MKDPCHLHSTALGQEVEGPLRAWAGAGDEALLWLRGGRKAGDRASVGRQETPACLPRGTSRQCRSA